MKDEILENLLRRDKWDENGLFPREDKGNFPRGDNPNCGHQTPRTHSLLVVAILYLKKIFGRRQTDDVVKFKLAR